MLFFYTNSVENAYKIEMLSGKFWDTRPFMSVSRSANSQCLSKEVPDALNFPACTLKSDFTAALESLLLQTRAARES